MTVTSSAVRPRILSGVQPSGSLHLGNYFGAIRRHVAMQDEGDCYFFIADYHALTSLRDRAALQAYTRDVALTYLAVGLDPARTVFYRQSDLPEVTELMWLLATATGMGLLERAHSYKEKVARGLGASVGLFSYPVLMAADILAPQADLVPVGQDQDQHVEFTRDMAQLFHNAYCPDEPVFRLPTAKIGEAARVPGTTFEKGSVLHVATTLGLRRRDNGQLAEPEVYAGEFRALLGELLRVHGEEQLRTTEDLAQLLAVAHGERLPQYEVQERVLRVVATNPGEHCVATPRQEGLGLEFYAPLDRVLFLTKDGQRQAAKMSKSQGNTIPIFAEGKELKKKVMAIETRLVDLASPLDWREDIVFQLYTLFAEPAEVAAMRSNYEAGGFGYGNAKKALLERIDTMMGPFRERRRQLEQQPDYVEDVLRSGAAKARLVIGETLARARDACGLGRRH